MTGQGTRRRPQGCASELQLEELVAGDLAGGPAEGRLRAHVESCARCRARVAELRAGEVLVPDPAAWRPLLAELATARPTARQRPRRFVAALVATAAVAAGVVLALRLAAPPGGGERVKGGVVLTVIVKRAGGAVDEIVDQGRLVPGEEMRFAVQAAAGGQAVVLGLDAAPAVTVYLPRTGSGAAAPQVQPSQRTLLEGSVLADETGGAERIFAIVCDGEPRPEELRARAEKALAAAGGHPEAVSSLATGCAEASVLLHKGAREAPSPR